MDRLYWQRYSDPPLIEHIDDIIDDIDQALAKATAGR